MRLVITLIVLLTVFLAACSDTEPDRTTGPGTEESADPAGQNADAPSDGDDTDAEDEPRRDQELEVSEGAYEPRDRFEPNLLTTQEFAARIARSGPYAVHASGEEAAGGAVDSSERRWYAQDEDFVYDSGSQRVLRLGERSYVCTNDEGWTCREEPTEIYHLIERDIRADPSEYPVKKLGVRRIADTNADCYLVLHDDGDATFCLSEVGAPLSIEINSPGYRSSFVATNYSEEPRSGVFTLPALPE